MRNDFLFVSVFVAAIVLANISTSFFGPVAIPVNAFLLIGLDLSLRDRLHDKWAKDNLWPKMAAMIVLGGCISFLTCRDSGRIAAASCLAFMASSFGDATTYQAVQTMGYVYRVNISNLVGAAVDSMLFPLLAFGSCTPAIVLGQFVAKSFGGVVWSIILPLMLKGFSRGYAQPTRIHGHPDPRK